MSWFDIPDPWTDEIGEKYRVAMKTIGELARGIEGDHFPKRRRR